MQGKSVTLVNNPAESQACANTCDTTAIKQKAITFEYRANDGAYARAAYDITETSKRGILMNLDINLTKHQRDKRQDDNAVKHHCIEKAYL